MNPTEITIGVDFDGTCVTNEYPLIGKSIGAESFLRALGKQGIKLCLWTCRTGDELKQAVDWFKQNNIPLYGVNDNPKYMSWSSGRKVFFDLVIDDISVGIPLIPNTVKPIVDWKRLAPELFLRIIELRKHKNIT